MIIRIALIILSEYLIIARLYKGPHVLYIGQKRVRYE